MTSRAAATSFLWFCFDVWKKKRCRRRVRRVGKWETAVWFSTFPCGVRLGGGNVEISPGLRDFQGAVESVGNLPLVFHAFHGPAISTALRESLASRRRGRFDFAVPQQLRLGLAHLPGASGVAALSG